MNRHNEQTEWLFLEDPCVGQRSTSASHTVSEAEIEAFAKRFDSQLIHLKEESETKLFRLSRQTWWQCVARWPAEFSGIDGQSGELSGSPG